MTTLSDSLLEEIERTAAELARVAGAEIETALGRVLAVRYKGDGTATTDPVSEVDHHVEVVIRARLGERFPDHAIIGEEIDEGAAEAREFTRVVDLIDGTANFVDGFPLFAASVGVLHEGRPVAGALWCSTSHACRAGVYHAREAGPLRFEGEALETRRNPGVRRHLVGEPAPASRAWRRGRAGDRLGRDRVRVRGRGPAARRPVPGPERLGRGRRRGPGPRGGLEARWRGPDGWRPLDRFGPPAGGGGLRRWRGPVAIGEPEAVDALCRANP